MRVSGTVAPALMALLALSVASCRQIAGIDGRSAETSGARCGALAAAADTCSTCLAGACCAEARACATDSECRALFACLDACGDDACRVACRAARPQAFSDVAAALSACQSQACGSACGATTCGGYVFQSNTCAACAASSCCSQASDCAGDEACTALAFCSRGCGDDLKCASECTTNHRDGFDSEQLLGACVQKQCDVVCGGHAWDCVGSVVWPQGVGSVRYTLTLSDYTSTKPLPGVDCKPCAKTDALCSNPVASPALTDQKGAVAFELPAGFDGYVDCSGGGVFPMLWFTTAPIVQDTVQGVLLLTNATFPVVAALIGTPDPARGHLYVRAADCSHLPGAHVSFAATPSDAETVPFYFIQSLPSKTATETDSSGRGGFGNLPPGVVTVRATVNPVGLRTTERTLLIRKGTFTYTELWPSP